MALSRWRGGCFSAAAGRRNRKPCDERAREQRAAVRAAQRAEVLHDGLKEFGAAARRHAADEEHVPARLLPRTAAAAAAAERLLAVAACMQAMA